MERVKKSFVEWFLARRGALKWSQRELADAASVALRTISRIESGERTPQKQSLRALARAMGVPEDEMIQRARGVVPRGAVPTQLEVTTPAELGRALKVFAAMEESAQLQAMRIVNDDEARSVLWAVANRLRTMGVQGIRSSGSTGSGEASRAPANEVEPSPT